MKPFRGKRRGPQSPFVGFSSPASRRARRRHPQGVRRVRTAGRRVHFRRMERHDRFVGGQKPPKKVTDPSWVGVTTSDGVGPSADRGRPFRAVGVGSGDPFVRSTCGDCRQCPLTADVRHRRSVGVDSGSVANRSVTCPTRLVTRTKESNMCASQWVLRNLEAK